MKQLSFFSEQLGEIVWLARSKGVGKTLLQVAASHASEVSLSTLKAAEAGRHIREEQLRIVARAFEMRPLDWIETKIRYVEAYMNEYLVPPSSANQDTANIDPRVLKDFEGRRRTWLQQDQAEFPIHHVRFKLEVQKAFKEAGKQSLDVCDAVGVSKSKKDKFHVAFPTVTALRRAQHIRPEKFGAICRRLDLSRSALIVMKISYAEAYLGEYLLGHDAKIWSRANSVDYPRTVALLIYSTEHAKELA